MKRLILGSVMVLFTTTASAQGPPKFFKDTYPEDALKSALQARSVLQGEGAQLDAKTRELISLGVDAQIPCNYCKLLKGRKAFLSDANTLSSPGSDHGN